VSRLTLLAVPLLLVLDLTFFSEGSFLLAYVFFGADSVFVVEDFPAVLEGLVEGTCFLTVLTTLGVEVFEDGALRPLVVFVVADLPVTVFVFDPGLATAFGAVFVVVVLAVFEAGLFCSATVTGSTEPFHERDSPLSHHQQP